jgi:hypothetical protein
MSQSQGLSDRRINTILNEDSKIDENLLETVVEDVVDFLKLKFPNRNFGIEKKMTTREMKRYLLRRFGEHNIPCGMDYWKSFKETTGIKPDGGFIWVEINNQKYYLCVSEMKRQGTNDILLQNTIKYYQENYGEDWLDKIDMCWGSGGSKKMLFKRKNAPKILYTDSIYEKIFTPQQKGNAIERAAKNMYHCDEKLFGNDKIFPYVIFASGTDLHESSTILDRAKTLICLPTNQINLYRVKTSECKMSGGSIFLKGHHWTELPGTSDFTYEELYNIILEITEGSLKHYLELNGE